MLAFIGHTRYDVTFYVHDGATFNIVTVFMRVFSYK